VRGAERLTGLPLRALADSGTGYTVMASGSDAAVSLLCAGFLLTVVATSSLTYRLVEEPARLYFNALAPRLSNTPGPRNRRAHDRRHRLKICCCNQRPVNVLCLKQIRKSRMFQARELMGTILIIVLIILLLGGGGGYYGYRSYGGAGLGGALGLVLLVLIILWLFGVFAAHTPTP
jgi:peptidoglycan/LPS O-acetylase OafA/YrhL